MLNDIKVGIKLIGSIVAICLIAAAVILYGIKVRNDVMHKVDSVHRQYEVNIRDIGNIRVSLEKMGGDIYRYLGAPADRQKTGQEINETISSVNDIMQSYKNRNIGAEERKLIDDFESAWSEMQRGYKEGMKAANEGRQEEINRFLGAGSSVVQAREKTLAALRNLNNYSVNANEAAIKATVENVGGVSSIMLILSAIAIALAIVLMVFLTESITKPLKKGVLMMAEMKKGHLSNRLGINRKDEIGLLADAMDEFADHLQKNIIFNMQQISEGNINVNQTVIDDKDEIGPALKKIIETINNLLSEINILTKSATDGKLDVRG
ncbi:MAG: MCP four helix bundle domain-containing protein, partial [Smithella sp.]